MATINFFPELIKLQEKGSSIPLSDLKQNTKAITEIQTLLMKEGFIKPKANFIPGILDADTISAYAQFKRKSYLEYPELIGKSTIKTLLEIVEIGQHPHPLDNPINYINAKVTDKDDKKIRLPNNEWVSLSQPIANSEFFSWAEATKNGQRIPETKEVVNNIVKLAEYLKLLKIYLDRRTILVNSWYRPAKINAAVGGVSNSIHIGGLAADVVVVGIPPLELYKKINTWHGSNGGLGKSTAFTHIDLRGYTARWIY